MPLCADVSHVSVYMPISGVKLSDFLEPNFAISETSKVDNNCLHVVLARGARYAMSVFVCMHVCVSVCLSSSIYRKSDVHIFYRIFDAFCPWPWFCRPLLAALRYVIYFRSKGKATNPSLTTPYSKEANRCEQLTHGRYLAAP